MLNCSHGPTLRLHDYPTCAGWGHELTAFGKHGGWAGNHELRQGWAKVAASYQMLFDLCVSLGHMRGATPSIGEHHYSSLRAH